MTYRAPVNEMLFMMRHVGELQRAIDEGIYPDLSLDVVENILQEAARFSGEVLAPINRSGDRHGAQLRDGVVTTAPGFKEAYQAWIGGGWNALAGPAEYGGQDLPLLLNAGCSEMWNGACLAFGVAPLLTFGGVEALAAHGCEDLKQRYLSKLVAGEWTATMNLTEPQAGSDLSAIRTRAEPCGDGSYRICGQKIFISYGEHDLTDNIVHLVLARLPDAPKGTRGISLFLVPKVLPNGSHNDVRCSSLEHKLGIHASPTCTMIYGDGGGARPLATMPRIRRAAGGQRARRAVDPGRQGVRDRCRHRGGIARHPGARRDGLHRGDRRCSASARRQDPVHLRRQQRHSGDRFGHTKAPDVRRRNGARPNRRDAPNRGTTGGRRLHELTGGGAANRQSRRQSRAGDAVHARCARRERHRGGARRSKPLFAAVRDGAGRRAVRRIGACGASRSECRRQRSGECRTRAARAVFCRQHRAERAGTRGGGGCRRGFTRGRTTDVGRLSRRAALPISRTCGTSGTLSVTEQRRMP